MLAKRAVIYARVSTDDQAERGYSLPSQIDACREYAQRNNFYIVGQFSDDYSGAKLDRPEFTKLRAVIADKGADVLIVFSSDRLTRSLAHALIIREELQMTNVELHYVRRGKSEDTPEARMMDNIEGVFNEYWREKIAEASRRGLRRKAESGKVVGMGGALYGYRLNKASGNLELDEQESSVVKLIYQLYTVGNDQGKKLSQNAIAIHLSRLGVDTPGCGKNRRRRKKPSHIWNEYTIKTILTNEAYAGVWRFGKIANGKKRTIRPLEERVCVNVPVIVPRELWLLAQEQRTINVRMSPRSAKSQFLMRGMIRCQKCNRSLVGSTRKYRRTSEDKRRYYYCSGISDALTGLEERCKQPMVHADAVEKLAWNYIVSIMLDESIFRQGLIDAQAQASQATVSRKTELELVTKLLSDRTIEISNIASQLAKVSPNSTFGQALLAQAETLEREHSGLAERKQELEHHISSDNLTEADFSYAMNFRKQILDGLQDATFDDKRNILQTLKVKVWLNGYTMTVNCIIPTSPERQQFDVGTPTYKSHNYTRRSTKYSPHSSPPAQWLADQWTWGAESSAGWDHSAPSRTSHTDTSPPTTQTADHSPSHHSMSNAAACSSCWP